jgi:hypothetical protein
MSPLLTTRDSEGGVRFRPLAIPFIIAAIIVPVVAAFGLAGILGAGLGVAIGAIAATGLVVGAARARPQLPIEVAQSDEPGHRVLVVAVAEATAETAERIAELAGSPTDVRVVVPVPSHRLDRWLSAEDDARREAEGRLARSAGALVAAGLPVSGSVGDPDPAQALEDELHDFAANEVVLLTGDGKDPLAKVESRIRLPLRRISAEPEGR